RLNDFRRYIRSTDKATAYSITCYICNRTTHVNIDTFEASFCHTNTHLTKVFRLISPYVCNNWLLILCKSQSPTHTKASLRMTVSFCVCKLCEKHVRPCRFTNHMTKYYICYIFHWC